MPGMSIHVVDVSRGRVAEGMHVTVQRIGPAGEPTATLAIGTIDATGVLADPALDQTLPAGCYRVRFAVAAFYRSIATPLPATPFLDTVVYDFGIDSPAEHYHLPFKCTPWGYSCFRGGA